VPSCHPGWTGGCLTFATMGEPGWRGIATLRPGPGRQSGRLGRGPGRWGLARSLLPRCRMRGTGWTH
jgi:hypothetical protein